MKTVLFAALLVTVLGFSTGFSADSTNENCCCTHESKTYSDGAKLVLTDGTVLTCAKLVLTDGTVLTFPWLFLGFVATVSRSQPVTHAALYLFPHG